MIRYLEYLPPLRAWIPAVIILALVLAFGLYARRKGVTNAATTSFWWSTAMLAIVVTAWVILALKPHEDDRPVRSFVLGFIPSYIGGVSLAGALAASFHALRRRRVAIIVAGTLLVATVAYPFAFLAMMLAACMTGAGCI